MSQPRCAWKMIKSHMEYFYIIFPNFLHEGKRWQYYLWKCSTKCYINACYIEYISPNTLEYIFLNIVTIPLP